MADNGNRVKLPASAVDINFSAGYTFYMGHTTTATTVKYITTSKAAEKTGYPERTLRFWCASGHLESIQAGRAYLIPESALVGLKRPERKIPDQPVKAKKVRKKKTVTR